MRKALLNELFPLQRAVVVSKRMFTCLLSGRRSGKSIAIVFMILLALIEAKANEYVVYTVSLLGLVECSLWARGLS